MCLTDTKYLKGGKKMKLFKCDICGNIVELINNGGGTLVCCGEEMKEIVLSAEETTYEKHIPVVTKENDVLTVQVGSTIHPMTEAHYIEWIAVVEGDVVTKKTLHPNDEPTASFEVSSDSYEVYAYCNLHGFYKAN